MLDEIMRLQAWVADLMERLRDERSENKALRAEIKKKDRQINFLTDTFSLMRDEGSFDKAVEKPDPLFKNH